MYTVHTTLYIQHCPYNTVHTTLYIQHCTYNTVHTTLYVPGRVLVATVGV